MKYRYATIFIAGCALSIWASTAFSHESKAKAKSHASAKEQKEWGIAGEAKAVKRTITLTMSDTMRFTPDKISVREGETVRLALKNAGAIMHELVIGTRKELEEHAALMVKFPNMEHSEPYMAHVAPGKAGEIIWTFNRPGTFAFACLIAGHYQAGMTGSITVAPATAKP
jgi:uncharacterized cupredoxin-like copper-binding protein